LTVGHEDDLVHLVLTTPARSDWMVFCKFEVIDYIITKHGEIEIDKIGRRLTEVVPEDFGDAGELLRFAADMHESGYRPDQSDIIILRNVIENLRNLVNEEKGPLIRRA
jgi:hypothetical protein